MGKPGLSEADKQWIAGLIKPISEDVHSLKEDVKVLKEDMVEVKTLSLIHISEPTRH